MESACVVEGDGSLVCDFSAEELLECFDPSQQPRPQVCDFSEIEPPEPDVPVPERLLQPAVPVPGRLLQPAVHVVSRTVGRKHGKDTDKLILDYVKLYGKSWVKISRHLGGTPAGFSVDTVRGRASRLLGTAIVAEKRKRRGAAPVSRWTKREDDALLALIDAEKGYRRQPRLWARAGFMLNRTPHACRNRLMRLRPYTTAVPCATAVPVPPQSIPRYSPEL